MENKTDELLRWVPSIINIGVQEFAESLQTQGAATLQVDWSPPAGGDREMIELREKLV